MSMTLSDEKFEEAKERSDCFILNNYTILVQGVIFYKDAWMKEKIALDDQATNS